MVQGRTLLETKLRALLNVQTDSLSFAWPLARFATKFTLCTGSGATNTEDGTQQRFIAMNWVTSKGELSYTYRKAHLWIPSDFERNNFVPGKALSPIVELCGIKVGCLICFDAEVVEPARCLALAGAQLLLVIGANSDSFTLENLVRVRAFENLCHLIYCNQMEAPCIGGSVGVNPKGEFLAGAPLPRNAPGAAVVVVEPCLEKFLQHRLRNPLFQVRQPALYSPIPRLPATEEIAQAPP